MKLFACFQLCVKLCAPTFVGTFGHFAFFIQEAKNTELCFNKIYYRLVVGELNKSPIDTFPHIFFLFEFKNMLIELLLENFVCIIYAKLLKAIYLKMFKAVNIKNANKRIRVTR